MDVTFQRESLTRELLAEAMPLIRAHYEEVRKWPDVALNVDELAYLHMQQAGVIRVYTARDKDWRLVGYASYFVHAQPQFCDAVDAVEDAIYVLPECRNGYIGRRLLRFTEDQLQAEGVRLIYQHAPEGHGFAHLLTHLGYEPVYTLYARRLNDGGNLKYHGGADRSGGEPRGGRDHGRSPGGDAA